MKALSLLCLTLAFAPLAPAALEYVAYDLGTKTAEPVKNPDFKDEIYHSYTIERGSKILFVRDTSLPDQTYYIGVFELTCNQARQLGLPSSTISGGGAAYGVEYSRDRFLFASPPSLANAPGLGFPTADQWLAYAEQLTEADADSTNVLHGASIGGSYSLDAWYDQSSKWEDNSHGVIDLFGNVAEYTYTPTTGKGSFYGWFTSSLPEYRWDALKGKTPEQTALDAFEVRGDPTAVWGARLIYTTPEARTYTLTVTLDGTPKDVREGLHEKESITVDAPKPEGQRRLSGREVTGLDSASLPEALDAQLPFDMPASDVTIAYTSEPYATLTVENGTATVTHGEETVTADEQTQVVAGDVVTLTARAPGAHERFTGWTVTVGDGEPQPLEPTEDETTGESVYRYDIPALDGIASFTFTAAFESIPYATLTVQGGTATVDGRRVTEVEAGDVVTLTPDALGEHQAFLGWTCPEGITLKEGNTFTVPTLQGGERYVFAADIRTYPRVLVFGGSISRVSSGRDDGDGYYAPGTSLTLQASAPAGYVHDGWTDGSQRVTSPYTVPNDYDVTITLTATYTRDESSEPTVTPADIHLGSTKTEAGYQAHSLFGWTPGNAETTLPDVDGNRYHFYDYVNAGLFAILPLTGNDRTIVYQEAVSSTENPAPQAPTAPQMPNIAGLPLNQREPALEAYYTELEQYQQELTAYQEAVNAWQSSAPTTTTFSAERLLLRRVSPTTEGKRDFYLGVYETPIGNIANLEKLTSGKTDYEKESTQDYRNQVFCANALLDLGFPLLNIPDFKAYLDQLSTAFKVNARFPTQEDVRAVGDHSASENAGEGYGLDPDLEDSMVVNGGSRSQLVAADGMTVDPYGFYGLWGNCWEASSNEVGFGGAAVFGNKNSCRTDMTSDLYGIGAQQYLSLRPVIDVEQTVVIYVGQESAATAVQIAPGQRLFADGTEPTKSGHRFKGWTLGEGSIDTNHVVTEADDGKVLVANWEPLPEHPDSVTVACENCLGPATAYPGQSVTVYPPAGRTFDAAAPLTVEPEAAATKVALNEDGTVTVTFASPLPVGATAVTLQGKLAAPPEPLRPGYRFRLR